MKYIYKQLSIEDTFIDNPTVLVVDNVLSPPSEWESLNMFYNRTGLTLVTIVHNRRTTLGIFTGSREGI